MNLTIIGGKDNSPLKEMLPNVGIPSGLHLVTFVDHFMGPP